MAEVPANVMPEPSPELDSQIEKMAEGRSEAEKTQELKAGVREERQSEATLKGSKTEERNLYAALEEERRMRQARDHEIEGLKREIDSFKSSAPPYTEGAYSDEGKELKRQLESMKKDLTSLQDEKELEKLYGLYPDLREHSVDFNKFREEYPRHKPENIAKLFLVEKGLLGAERKGLEKASGGTRAVPESSLSEADVKRLRETNFREYAKQLREGKLDPANIRR